MNKPLVTDIILKEVEPSGLEELAAMHLAIWQQAYLPIFSEKELQGLEADEFRKDWKGRTADGGREIRWILLNGRKAGFLSFIPDGKDIAEITHFYLLPSYWGGGVSSAAMKSLLLLLLAEGIKEVNLWVLSGNIRAQQFYMSSGFRHNGQQRVRYGHGLRLEEVLMSYRL
jgi:RimJ/RimL family protein N-acetyltransferase